MTYTAMPSAAPNYRKDIDGLRAIAVLSVLVYHAFPELLPGGFTGVDIFFVISGFVITKSNLKDIAAGDFTWWRFYQRRVRRLMPALLLVIGASLAIGWVTMSPGAYLQLGASAISALLFAPNFRLLGEGGYFDTLASTKPLLHLWSLGIEEQFYLVWPLAALLLGRRGLLAPVLAAGALTSLILCVWLTSIDRNAAFYLPFTRFWELAAGCLLALWPLRCNARLGHILSVLAAVGLIASAILIDEAGFPGASALLPVAAAALLIATGPVSIVNARLLSLQPLVWIGRVSYPLYLWHWPLLVFASISFGPSLSAPVLVCILVLSVALSGLTYHLVELPFRQRYSMRVLVFGAATGSALLGFVALGIVQSGGALPRFPAEIQAVLAFQTYEYQRDARYPACWLGDGTPFADAAAECLPNADHSRPYVALWGDSHAARFYPGLRQAIDGDLAQFTRNGCPPILDVGTAGCKSGNLDVVEEIRRNPPDHVLMFGAWLNQEGWVGAAPLVEKLDHTIAALQAAGVARITLVGPAPVFAGDLPSQIYSYWQANGVLPDRLSGDADGRIFPIISALAAVAHHRQIEFISVYDLACDQSGCLTHVPDNPTALLSWDYGHLTTAGAIWLAGRMADIGVLAR